MKTTKLSLLFALLLTPAVTLANSLSIDWTGQIWDYGSVGSDFPPAPLSDPAISGVIDLNLGLLPAPDQGNPFGVVSFTGTDFLQSSVQWAGGTFQPDPPGGAASDSLYFNFLPGQSQATINESGAYVDTQGVAHQALLSLSVTGLLQYTPGQGLSLGSGLSSGAFADFTLDDTQGFIAQFQVDSISVAPGTVSVPEPDTASLSVGMLLALGVTLIRGRRRARNFANMT